MSILLVIASCIVTILVLVRADQLRKKLEHEKLRHDITFREKQDQLQALRLVHAQDLLSKVHDMKELAEEKAQERFIMWKNAEIVGIRAQATHNAEEAAKIALEHWIILNEDKIRTDAIKRSGEITKGKITEHLIPYFPDFPYNPKDCRFLGSPIDLIVFDGMSEGQITKIVLLEIKTGKSGLTTRERGVRDCAEEGLVEWKEIRV